MRGFSRFLTIVLCLVAIAAPARAEWKEARSGNFVVYSESSEAELRKATAKLEKFDFMLRAVSGSTGKDSSVPLKVYLMRNFDAVQDTMGSGGSGGVAGYYVASSRGPISVGTQIDYEATAPGYTRAGGLIKLLGGEAVLLHEYAHHFMLQHFPAAYPSWYSEGFAEYYSTTRFLDNDVIEVGHAVPHRYFAFEMNDWLPLNRLLTAKTYADVGENIDLLYAQGWLLVHYLGNAASRQGQLSNYLEALNRGADYEKAMDLAFGRGARELDAELRSYSKKGRLNAIRLPFKPIEVGKIAIRSLSPAEDALLESEIALGRGILVREAGAFASKVRRIAARFPNDPHALEILAEAERAAGNQQAASATVAAWLSVDPKNGRAKLFQAQLAIESLGTTRSSDANAWNAARALILDANRLAPNDPMILEAYYDSFVAQGQHPPVGAQNALYRAFQLVPQDEDIRHKLARDFEMRNLLQDAITIIKPLAMQSHDSEESAGKRAKRNRREEKYRVVGDAVEGISAREMLDRLEKKLAEQPAA